MLLKKKVIVFARLGGKLKVVQFPPTTEHQNQGIFVPKRYQNMHGQYWAENVTFNFTLKKYINNPFRPQVVSGFA